VRSDWVAVATLTRPRGNRGELAAVSLTTDAGRFDSITRVVLKREDAESGREAVVEHAWMHGGTLILKFRDVDSISAAQELAGLDVCIPAGERRPLDEGEYFQSDLIGCVVVDVDSGQPLGTVTAFVEGTGPGLLELDSGMLIPFVKSILTGIDPAGRKIVASLPQGLKDLNAL
jgi:16S rRNA processing protein RimM